MEALSPGVSAPALCTRRRHQKKSQPQNSMESKGINPQLCVLCPAPNSLVAEGQHYHAGKVTGNGSGRAPSLQLCQRSFVSDCVPQLEQDGEGKGSYLTREIMTCSRGMLKSSGNAQAPFPAPAPGFGRQPGKVCAPLGWYPRCCHGNEQRGGDGADAIILLCSSSSLPKVTSPGIRNYIPPSPGSAFPSLPELHLCLGSEREICE